MMIDFDDNDDCDDGSGVDDDDNYNREIDCKHRLSRMEDGCIKYRLVIIIIIIIITIIIIIIISCFDTSVQFIPIHLSDISMQLACDSI